MKKNIGSFIFVLTFGLIFITASGFYRLQDKDKDNKGKDIFVSNKCNSCHTVESQKIDKTGKMKAPDLSSVGNDHDAKWFASFLEKKESLNDKKHPIAFKGDQKDLTTLTTWLASMKQTGTSIRSSDKKESGK